MKRILIVDGDKGIRSMLANILSEFLDDIQIVLSSSGSDALSLIQRCRHEFDLVVTGVVMTPIDGLELTSKLKQTTPNLPVIIMSGSPEPVGHMANAFVQKPFDIKVLAEIIRQLLERPAI